MGLSFKKELILDRTQVEGPSVGTSGNVVLAQVYPPDLVDMVFANEKTTGDQTKLQTRLIQKLGRGSRGGGRRRRLISGKQTWKNVQA